MGGSYMDPAGPLAQQLGPQWREEMARGRWTVEPGAPATRVQLREMRSGKLVAVVSGAPRDDLAELLSQRIRAFNEGEIDTLSLVAQGPSVTFEWVN